MQHVEISRRKSSQKQDDENKRKRFHFWSHRIHDGQQPTLLFLELLTFDFFLDPAGTIGWTWGDFLVPLRNRWESRKGNA